MRLFHRTNKRNATAILRDGFKDRPSRPGDEDRFGGPPTKDMWFSQGPSDGKKGVTLFLLEIPDEVFDESYTQIITTGTRNRNKIDAPPDQVWYAIPAEVANQYGPPTDITDSESDY